MERKTTREFERAVRIAHDHILYAQRFPDRMAELAQQLGVSEATALAIAIADQLTEEFTLTER